MLVNVTEAQNNNPFVKAKHINQVTTTIEFFFVQSSDLMCELNTNKVNIYFIISHEAFQYKLPLS